MPADVKRFGRFSALRAARDVRREFPCGRDHVHNLLQAVLQRFEVVFERAKAIEQFELVVQAGERGDVRRQCGNDGSLSNGVTSVPVNGSSGSPCSQRS